MVQTLPSRGGVVRALTKEDFSQMGAIFLRELADLDQEAVELAKTIQKNFAELLG